MNDPNQELARLLKSYMIREDQSLNDVTGAVGKMSRNRLWRFLYPNAKRPNNEKYGPGYVRLEEAHALCGLMGVGLAALDGSRPVDTWADCEKAINSLPDLSPESRASVIEIARAAYLGFRTLDNATDSD